MKAAILSFSGLLVGLSAAEKDMPPVRVMIINGQNNHDWRITTDALRATLDATGRFAVQVETAPQETVPAAPRRPRSEDPAVRGL